MSFSPNDMWRMGGLAFRMPVTAISFLAGSLALSGFPLITAGFWSKDEILAQAWSANRPVFWVLLFAAAVTGFYSARQISLTFLGKPRTRAATYTRENPAVMVVPLAILAVFAITLGWVGIPEDFPLLGRWIPGGFGPFVERSIEGMHDLLHAGAGEAKASAGSALPLLFGLLASLGGLLGGWLVYGRKPITATQEAGAPAAALVRDPVEVGLARLRLGWLYQALANQFYFNEVYQRVVVRPAVFLADACSYVDSKAIDATVVAFARGFGQHGRVGPAVDSFDRNVFDGMVNGAGMLSRISARFVHWLDEGLLDGLINTLTGLGRLSAGGLHLFDEGVIDGVVKATANGFGALGHRARRMQTGLLPDYLWNAFVIILLLVAALVLFQYA
jgi:NADH-quinone oxidoreductase subunit L